MVNKPIRRDITRKLPIVRPTYEGPLTPRLRSPQPKDAIGFVHHPVPVLVETGYEAGRIKWIEQ